MKIIYTDKLGRLCEVFPSSFYSDKLEKCADISVPKDCCYKIVEDDYLPSDYTFFDAWVDTGSKVEVDIVRACEIQKEYIRQEREPLLRELDIRQLRGEDVDAEKQELRDFTKRVDGVEDLEVLKTILPTK